MKIGNIKDENDLIISTIDLSSGMYFISIYNESKKEN